MFPKADSTKVTGGEEALSEESRTVLHLKDPQNWSRLKKWLFVTVLSFVDFLTYVYDDHRPLASLMYAASIPVTTANLKSTSGALGSFSMTVYVLGFAIGPLIVGPISDVYGRIWIYRSCMVLFLVFTVACGVSTDIGMLIGFRFLAGCAGGSLIVLGGAMIKEMFKEETRGRAMSIYFLGPVLGPLLGPVFGGFISESIGWRWNFYIIGISSCTSVIAAFAILRETHLQAIIRTKSKDQNYIRKGPHGDAEPVSLQIVIFVVLRAWLEPGKVVFSSVLMFLFMLFICQFNGLFNLLSATQSAIFINEYSFTSGQAGLTYLGAGLGGMFSVVLLSTGSDRAYAILKRRNNGQSEPRHRLVFVLWGALAYSGGLTFYGWTLHYKVYWIVPLLGLSIFGFGYFAATVPSNLYLLEVFPKNPASALAAGQVARSLGRSLIPIAGTTIYDACGYGWGNTLLALINLLFWIVPAVLFLYRRSA